MSFQDTLVDVIDTSETKKPNSPQFKFTNPLKKNIFVNSIQLSFDSYFSEKGAVLIKINGNPILHKLAGSFKRLQTFKVPMQNEEFLQQRQIEIFAWNGIDSNLVSVGYDIQISEDPTSSQVANSPLSQVKRNSAISGAETVFSQDNYSDEILTKIIDMKGFKKMILNIASTKNIPILDSSDFDSLPENAVDLDLTTKSTSSVTSGQSDFLIADFQDIYTQNLSLKLESLTGSNVSKITVEISNNKFAWTKIYDQNIGATSQHIVNLGTNTYRYVRVKNTYVSGGSNLILQLYEVYDGDAFGGSASISFEILDNSSGKWLTLIDSSDIGSVTFGNELVKQIGDVLNDVGNNKFNAVLPSSQTNFRCKMVVVGNLNTGVSVIKVQ